MRKVDWTFYLVWDQENSRSQWSFWTVGECSGAEDRTLGRQTRLLFLGRGLTGLGSRQHTVGVW